MRKRRNREDWPKGSIGGVLRSQTLDFAPTARPIHEAKDISGNGNSFEGATTSWVIHSFSEVSVPEAFFEEVIKWAWQRMKDGLRA
jgi:hypothetical protein